MSPRASPEPQLHRKRRGTQPLEIKKLLLIPQSTPLRGALFYVENRKNIKCTSSFRDEKKMIQIRCGVGNIPSRSISNQLRA